MIYMSLISDSREESGLVELVIDRGFEDTIKQDNGLIPRLQALERIESITESSAELLQYVQSDSVRVKNSPNVPGSEEDRRAVSLQALMRMAQTCSQFHLEIVSVWSAEVELCAISPFSACWFGLRYPSFASQLKYLMLQQDWYISGAKRLLVQLMRVFPNIGYLRTGLSIVHRHKTLSSDKCDYGSLDLRSLKTVLENSSMNLVAAYPTSGSRLQIAYFVCSTSAGWKKYQATRGKDGRDHRSIDVLAELNKEPFKCDKNDCQWKGAESLFGSGIRHRS